MSFQPKEELFINISKLSLSSSPLNQRSYNLDTRKSHRQDICGGYYHCQTDRMPKENCLKRILNRNRRKSIKGKYNQHFWLRQELKKWQSVSVRPFGDKLFKALNFHHFWELTSRWLQDDSEHSESVKQVFREYLKSTQRVIREHESSQTSS